MFVYTCSIPTTILHMRDITQSCTYLHIHLWFEFQARSKPIIALAVDEQTLHTPFPLDRPETCPAERFRSSLLQVWQQSSVSTISTTLCSMRGGLGDERPRPEVQNRCKHSATQEPVIRRLTAWKMGLTGRFWDVLGRNRGDERHKISCTIRSQPEPSSECDGGRFFPASSALMR